MSLVGPQPGWSGHSHTCPSSEEEAERATSTALPVIGTVGACGLWAALGPCDLTSLNGPLHFYSLASFTGGPRWHVLRWPGPDLGSLGPLPGL